MDSKTVTTSTGDYTVAYLLPGTYTITVTRQGFKTEIKTDILLNVDQTSTINFALEVGSANETVKVDSSATQIELSKADYGTVIDNERVKELPLDGRNPFTLFNLSPGTHDFSATQYPRPFDGVTGNQYVNGSPQTSQLNMDGGANDVSNGTAAFVPSVDSVQEFKIVLSTYDASYGHAGGSAVDLELKSGTNTFHGDVYEFARRTWLDAFDYGTRYSSAVSGTVPEKAQEKRDQYGFEAEGPFRIPHLVDGRNRLFYMLSYEQMNEIAPNNTYNTYSLPNPQWLTGDFSGAQYYDNVTNTLEPLIIYDPLTPLTTVVDPVDGLTKQAYQPFPGNRIPAGRMDPVGAAIANYLGQTYARPNVNPGAGYAPWQNNYQNLQTEHDLWRNGLFKIDYDPTERDKFSLRWGGQARWADTNLGPGFPNSDPANTAGISSNPHSITGQVTWTHIESASLMYNLSGVLNTYCICGQYGPREPFNVMQTLGFASGYYNQLANNSYFPQIYFQDFTTQASYPSLGSEFQSLGNGTGHHMIGFLPTVTYVRGEHTVRAGINLNFYQNSTPYGGNGDTYNFYPYFTSHYYAYDNDAPGMASGNSIAALLLGYPYVSQVWANNYPFYSYHYFAPWVQDDWKITSRLTLNLGLRWDLLTPLVERHNKMNGQVDLSMVNPASSQIPAGTAALGTSTTLLGGLTFAGVDGQPRSAYKMNMLNIQPRAGFAYAITPKMVVRGGIGNNYGDDQSTNSSLGYSASTTFYNTVDNYVTPYTSCAEGSTGPGGIAGCSGPGLQNPIPGVQQPTGNSLGALEGLGQSISFVNPNYQRPTFWQYSLWYEAAVSRWDRVSLGYVGNRAPNNPVSYDVDMISPLWNAQCDVERVGWQAGQPYPHDLCDNTATGQIANPFEGVAAFSGTSFYSNQTLSRSQFTRPYPEFTDITENNLTNEGRHWYNSIQAAMDHQVSRSLMLHATYTHARSMTSGQWVDQLNNVRQRQIESTNTIAHSFSLSGVGYLPFGRGRLFLSSRPGWVNEIVNGWEISPIYTYYSGFAWNLGSNWEDAQTGGPITGSMKVRRQTLPPDGQHNYQRIRGVTPCVGYKNSDTGIIIPSPAATAAGCQNSIQFVTSPNSYAVKRNNETTHVAQPGAYTFNTALSKNLRLPSMKYVSENTSLKINVDLLNVFNHPNWDEGYNTSPSSLDFGHHRQVGWTHEPATVYSAIGEV